MTAEPMTAQDMSWLDEGVEIGAEVGAGTIGVQGGGPMFYWASEASAPQGSPFVGDSGRIVTTPAYTRQAKLYSGWASNGFAEGDEHYSAMVAAGMPVFAITHRKAEVMHFGMPVLEFYPLLRAYMNELDLKGIDRGTEKAQRRGYQPGDRPGIAYGWKTSQEGKTTSYGYVQGVLRVTLRGTAGLFEDSPGTQLTEMVALPYRLGADGTMTPYFLDALANTQHAATILLRQRTALYAYWEDFYARARMDAEPVARLRAWLEGAVGRGLAHLPPYWVAARIGYADKPVTVGKGDNTKNMIPPSSWSGGEKAITIEEALGLVAMPYEIDMLGPQMPWAVDWSRQSSTVSRPREQEDRAV